MPSSQGRINRIVLPHRMVGKDENGQFTNNSIEFRGRPFARASGIEQEQLMAQRERVKLSWQKGLRALNFALTTGQITPSN